MTKNKKRKKQKKKLVIKNDIMIRTSLSIFFTSLFIVAFFLCGGAVYFYDVVVVSEFKGYDFQMHVIDVGQGDSLLLKFPNNETMLIDAGEEDEGDTVTTYVKNFLKQEGLERLNYLLLTHPDADHVGGAVKVLQEIEVDTIFRPKVYTHDELLEMDDTNVMESTTLIYDSVIKLIEEKGCNVIFNEKGLQYNFDGCEVEFLSPELDYYSSTNSTSAVIMVTYQTKKFLLTGDADAEIEETLIEEYGDYLNADVLKVAHHGSNSSSTTEFLSMVSPEYSILCTAKNKDLPSVEVINRLRAVNSRLVSTSSEGNFALTIENDGISIAEEPQPIFDIALIISIYVLALIFTWGIRSNKETKKKDIIRDNQIKNDI